MAVPKSKISRSRRGMRRSHNALFDQSLSSDRETGEIHMRHHITNNGFYKGEKVFEVKRKEEKNKKEK